MKRINDAMVMVCFLALLSFVAVVHFGCDEEPTRPDPSCGTGPFQYDAKNQVCRDLSTNGIVDIKCCP